MGCSAISVAGVMIFREHEEKNGQHQRG